MKQEDKKKKIRIPLVLIFIAGMIGALFFNQEAQCYQIKRVIRGSYDLGSAAEAVTVDISTQLGGIPLDVDKSFILATRRYADDDHDDGDIQVLIDDPTNIVIARYASALVMPIEWTIVEFEDGVDVVSGTTTMPETLTTKTITLPEHFDLSKSIPVINWKSWRHSDTADERNYFSATLTDTNKLKISRTELGSAYNNDISYQVIEFDRDVNVTYGINTISGVTSIDVPVSVSDVNKTLLFFTTAVGGGVGGREGAYSVRGYLADNDTLTFTRDNNLNFVDVYWYLAEFQNEPYSIRNGNYAFALANTAEPINVTISPQWDLTRTMFTHSFTLSSGTSTTVAERFYNTGQLSLSGSDVILTIQRQISGTAGVVAYNVMEFPPLDIITPTGGTTQIQEEQVILATQNVAASDTDASLNTTYPEWGQTWSYSSPSPGTTFVLDKISLNMSRSSPSTETLYMSIRETWNGAELTSATFDASQLTTTDTWYDIPMTQVTLNDGQTYYIHVYGSNPAQGYVDLRYGTNQYAGGYLYRSGVALTSDDLLFKIWEYISGEEPTYTPGDVWEIESGYDIIWKYADSLKSGGAGTGGVHRVKLEISKGGGAWQQIPGATALDVDTDPLDNEGAFSWPEIPAEIGDITNLIGEDLKIRITDIDMSARNYDISNGELIIKGTLSIYTPGVWKIGNTEDITWDYTGYLDELSPNTVTIKLSTDGGASFDHTLVTDASVGTGGSGSWPWTIPAELDGANLMGNDNVFKITLNYNPIPDETLVESISDAFSLMGQVNVVAPNGSDVWKIGETYDIIWDYGGNWGDVDIFVSRNNGGSWNLIDTVAGDYKSGPDIYDGKSYYSWTAEAPKSVEALIRIESHSYGSAIRDESDANFEIRQVITVTQPSTAGEVWKVGEYKDIVWQLQGVVDKVEIHYKKGAGGAWIPITESEYPTGYPAGSPYKYTWQVPNDIHNEVYIRVREYGHPEIEYITPYICIKGKINVDAPNGGEEYTVGQSDVVITWSATGTMTGNVRVWFAKDGVDYAYMDVTDAMGYPSGKDVNSGSLAWNPVPDEITVTGKIKVELIGDESSVYDVSNDTFSIQGGLTLTYPNGGVTLYVGATDSSRTITWDVDGNLAGQQVTLTYTVGGSGDKSIGSTGAMNGSFDWGASAGIPDDIGDNVIVKVALSSKPTTVFDVSDSANKIRGKIASISSPTSVDEWYVDSDIYNIAWTMENDAVSMGNLEIRYSTGGASFPATQVVETNVGPLASPVSWQVPDEANIITETAQIKIFAINYSSDILKISDEFKIKGKITLTRPAHGTDYTWYVGTNENIEWATKGITDIDKVNVYWDSGTETYTYQIADGITNAEGFLWQNIPAVVMGDTVRVKVAGYGDYSDVFDTSPQGTKYITVKGRVVVNSPNGSEEWVAGTQYPITWTPYGALGNVHLEYHDGIGWHDITNPVTGVPATKLSEPWIIPTDALPGSAYKVRITALAPYDDVTDESNNLFTVRGSVNLTYPDGGAAQEFNVNDTEDIRWTKTGAIGNIELRYSITGGEPYLLTNQIATNVSPTNQPEGEKYGAGVYYYPWSIPAPALSDTVKVKIFLISDADNVHDESVSTFKIKGSLQLTGEANGEGAPLWKVGENKTITWDVVGALGNINIYYAKDGVQFLNSVALSVPCGTGGNGSYLWEPIPNDVIDGARNANIKLKITTPAGDVSSISANPIIIQGQIIVAQPDPILYVDDPDNPNDYYTITWTTKGIVGQVKLSYDTDGNGTYENFIQQIVNDGDYNWNIPNAIGNQVKFKVEDSVYSQVFGTTTNFEIKGQIKVTSPDSTVKDANAWIVDNAASGLPSQQLIEWTNYGDLGFDGGSNYYVIIKHAPNGVTFSQTVTEFASGNSGPQNYNWTIPNSIAKINRIKVIDKNDSDVNDISDEFEIKGKLVVTKPGPAIGDDYFIGGAPIDITWNYAGTLGNIDMFISYDDGANWEVDPFATVDVGYSQPYQFSVPDNPTTQGKIKLEQTNDRTYVTSQSKRFDIKGAVFIDSPTSLTEWTVDAADNKIEWHTTGSIANVTLDLDTTSGGGGYSIPIVAPTPNDGEYIWNIPTDQYVAVTSGNITSNQCKVRIRDASDPTVEDFSDDFKIKPVLDLTAPVGGEKWYRGTSRYITWAAPKGKVDNLKIEYSLDAGSTWQTPAVTDSVPATAGQFLWLIPNTPNDDTVVKISKVGDPDIFDISPVWFSLFANVELLQPNGGVSLPIGSDYLIKWNPIGSLTECRIIYATVANPTPGDWKVCKDASEQLADIADPVNTTQFSWRIPDEPSTHVLVKIYEKSHADDVLDVSVDNNAIIGSIIVNHPTNGDVMIAEKPYAIQYTKVGSLTNFKIDYYDGSQWYPIVANTTSYPSYAWASVDDNISSTVKVRVTDVNNTTVYGESTSNNIIKGDIDLTSPNGYETLVVGVPFNITWNKWGSIGNIKIEYSTDDFVSDIRTIVDSYDANSSPRAWTPGIADITNADNVKVRLISIGGIPVTDKSLNPFKIQGKISNVQPSGSAVIWKKDETKNVTWDQDGNINSVDIKYKTISTDTFNKTLVTNHTGHADGPNSAQITVPDENSEDCWVQVLDHNNSEVKASSAQAFSIRPVITVSKPLLDSNIIVDSSNPDAIVWSLNGSTKVTLVDILYSTNGIGGPFDKTIATGVDATLGKYDWDNVADNISGTVVVMLIDKTGGTGNPNVWGKSPSFDIVGGISVIEPHQDEDLPAGNSKTIEWLTHGTLGDIKIYYYHDGNYEHIYTINSDTNDSWSWTVPPQIENQSTIKITDANTESESDVIAGISGQFDIIGNFKLYDPNADPPQTPPTVLLSGSSHTIEWNNYDLEGEIPNAKLEFFDGTTWHDIDYKSDPVGHDGLVGNTGSYSWTVPTDVRATNCYFKISDPNNSAASHTSNTFEVRPIITVSVPLSNAKWSIGTKTGNFIAWNVTGPATSVTIEYSKDNGSTYTYTIVSSLDAASSPYEWDIPTGEDILSTNQAKIKVSDTSKPVIFGTSASFMIKAAITVTRPDTNDSLPVLDIFNIEWTTTCTGVANMGNVKIEFRPKDTESYTLIDTVAFSSSPYTLWSPPANSIRGSTKEAQIKITDADNSEVYDTSDKFNIKGKIQINSPDLDAPTWFVGDTQQIKWTPTGTFSYVKIEYSTNGGTTWEVPPIAGTYANSASGVQGTYPWTIPDKIGSNLKVRISDANNSNVVAVSQVPFTIKANLTVTEPNGGETWYVGDTNRKIKWNSTGSIETVRIEYSKNNGGLWTEIISNAPAGLGAGEYQWSSVADAISDICLIRVSSTNDSTVNDVSNGVFYIKGKINVLIPDGSERWVVLSSGHNITWDMTGSIANVKITYSVDGGGYTNVIVGSTNAANRLYTWNSLPGHVSDDYRIKIADADDENNVSDISPAFNIIGEITVVEPSGGEQLNVGTNFKVEWTKKGDFPNVRLEYSTDGGANYNNQIVAETPSANLFYWWNNISEDTVSPNVVLKITDADDINVYDESELFKIQGIFDITAPDGGVVWAVGSVYDITWTTTGNVTHVTLEYSIDGGNTWIVPPIAENIVNTNSKSWTVPDTISDLARVRVSDANDPDASDMSAANFKIRGDLNVTSPNSGAESWLVGTSEPITWTVTGSIAKVKLEFSVDGQAYEQIPGADDLTADSGDGTGSFSWTIPNRISSNVMVKITNKDDPTVFDESDNSFIITGKLDLTSPIGGETWYVQEQEEISWTKIGSIPTVKLEYSLGGGAYIQITDAESLSGTTFNWIIPDAINEQVKVRVSNTNATKPTIPGVSGLFAIKGKLQLNNPNSSSIWEVDKQKNITWTRTGSIATVKLEYSYNGGSNYLPIAGAGNVNASLETFAWTIPNTISNDVTVRITNNSDSSVADTSPVFKIAAYLDLTSPNGGEILVVDDYKAVTWVKHGDIDYVDLSYSKNNGADGYPYPIATMVPASDQSYNWQVPDSIGTQLKVKISDHDGTSYTVGETSEGVFEIRGSLTLTSPVENDVWLCSTKHNITWTKTGSIANAKLQYSIDGGLSYPYTIIGTINASLGTYEWTTPNTVSKHAVVKITNLGDQNVYDESEEFVIRGGFTITAPVAGDRWAVGSNKWIRWNTLGIIPQVIIYYSKADGADGTWQTIISVNNTNSYEWNVPDEPGIITDIARIKIEDTADADANAISPQFTIHGVVTLTYPNGFEEFEVDASKTITWDVVGPIGNVKLEYSYDGGSNYTTVVEQTSAQAESFGWSPIPNTISTHCLVRISDADDQLVVDTSNNEFTIKGSLEVIVPNGGENYVVYHATENPVKEIIQWRTHGNIDDVNLEYSTNGGSSWNPIQTRLANVANDVTTYDWEVPNAISNTVKVRVTDSDNITVKDTSNENFNIVGKLRVIAANGGEKWEVLTTNTIRWYTVGSIAFINLYYKDNTGAYIPINTTPIGNAAGERSYSWNIPDTPTVTTPNARIKVEDANNQVIYDISDADFRIAARFQVTKPIAGEVLQAGALKRIEWNTYGTVNNVKLEYSTNGGGTFNTIQSSIPNNEFYDWIVANAVSTNVIIRVSDATDPGAYDDSDVFIIRATFNLFSPDPIAIHDLKVNNQYVVRWDQIGTTAAVKLEYSFLESFVSPILFDGQATIIPEEYQAGKFRYTWTVPDEIVDGIRQTVWIKVSDPNDINAYDTIGSFRIIPAVTVTSPDASCNWYVYNAQYNTTKHTITGTVTGSVPTLHLYYSANSGTTWNHIVNLAINTSGLGPHNWSYDWNVANAISGEVKVKAADTRDETAYSESVGNATVRAKFTLSTLLGGQVLTVGETTPITWVNSGTVTSVKIEYSTNSGTTWNPISENEGTPNDGIVANGAGNDGRTFNWTVPNNIGYNTRIRIRDANDPDPTDTEAYTSSTSDFRIKGALEVTSPVGGEFWEITKQYSITWNTTGTIPNVDILYSTDGGVNYTFIKTTTNDGSEPWTIPDSATPNARVRVRDSRAAENDVLGSSPADFHIAGYFQILSPNTGNEAWIVNSTYPIQWQWGGTVPNVKLYYSTDSGSSYTLINTFANGSGGGGTRSQNWTIPDDISNQVRVRVEDANDEAIYDISDNDFKIRGSFDLLTLNGGQRWITDEGGKDYEEELDAKLALGEITSEEREARRRQIKWIANGTIPNVKLQYSTDGFVSEVYNIVDSYPNAQSGQEASYNWTVPDDRSNTVKVRVVDINDNSVYGESNSNFVIDYYNISWTIQDLLTLNHLGELSVQDKPSDGVLYQIIITADGVGSPITLQVPYGSRVATWSQIGFGDVKKNYMADADKTMDPIFMETTTVHIWRAESQYAYNPSNNSLSGDTWLERDGSVISGGISCNINIYETGTLIKILSTGDTDDAAGVFHLKWDNTTLQSGKVYTTVVEIQIGTGAIFRTPNSFTITTEKTLKAMEDTIAQRLDIPLSLVRVQVKQALDDQTETIERKMNEQTSIIESKMNQQTMIITETLTSIEEPVSLLQASATAIKEAGEEFTEAALRQAGTLILPETIRIGEILKVNYQILPDVTPLLDVYNANKERVVNGRPMTESKDSPGSYYYELEISDKYFKPGETITVMASESNTGNLEIGSVIVETVAGRLILPNSVLMGETLQIRYSNLEGLKPLLTVINSEDEEVVTNNILEESSQTKGLYVYPLEITSSNFAGGAPMTVKVTESTTGSLEIGSVVVETTTLSEVQGLIAGQTGAIQGLKEDTLSALEGVESALSSGVNVGETLQNLKELVLKIPEETAGIITEQGPPEEISNLLNDISSRLVVLAGEEGYDISTMVTEALSKSPTLKDIQGKATNITDTTDLILSLLEEKFGEGNAPFVLVIYER